MKRAELEPTPWRRRVAAAGVLAVLAVVGITVVSSPATAASCYGASCNAKDPQEQGCNATAITVEEMSYAGYYLELRYSSGCWAMWVRVTSEGNWATRGTFRLERQSPSSYFSVTFAPQEDGLKWTKMYNRSYTLRGYMSIYNSSYNETSTFRTPWH